MSKLIVVILSAAALSACIGVEKSLAPKIATVISTPSAEVKQSTVTIIPPSNTQQISADGKTQETQTQKITPSNPLQTEQSKTTNDQPANSVATDINASQKIPLEPVAEVVATVTPAPNPSPVSESVQKPEQDKSLTIITQSAGNTIKPGDKLNFRIKTTRNAYLFCFYRDEENQIQRVFPNRFRNNNYMSAGQVLNFPGTMPFEMASSVRGIPEQLTCFTTERDVLSELPTSIKISDFVSLKVSSMEEIRQIFKRVSGTALSENSFKILR